MKLRKFFGVLCAAALLLSVLPAALAQETPAFTDMADIQHKEAATALVKLGVMSGKGDGTFDPAGTVTRGEGARMITLILTGGKDVIWESVSGVPASFPDIKGHWSEAYIEFCVRKGMAFSQGDGTFDPNGNITLFELLRLAEVALGRRPEEFTQATYWIGVAHSTALNRNLFAGLDDFTGKAIVDYPVTRDEAAQVLYNALNATPQILEGSSTGFYEDVRMPDGSPSTLLYECYGFRSWEDVTAPIPEQEPEPADPTGFRDAAQIEHWEAVAALCKLRIIDGREDGSFHPTDTVTRAECAKLVTAIMNGGRSLPSGVPVEPTTSFSDTQGHWAESYIEYCAKLGIISGRGNGCFDPDGQVTTLELVKMAEGMLGYDPKAYGLTGPAWADKVDELARWTSPSLYTDLSGVSMMEPVTRDNAAQILYNALQVTVKRVTAPTPAPDGTVIWQFVDAVRKDGTPIDLLWERFQIDSLEELGEIPDQPGR